MFPAFEDVKGKPGYLKANVEQHHEFEPGLKKPVAFTNDTKSEDYKGETLKGIIDEFAQGLQGHLHNEIPTLLAMRPYDSDALLKVHKKCEAAAGQQDKVRLQDSLVIISHTELVYRLLCRLWYSGFATRRPKVATIGLSCLRLLLTSFITSLPASMLSLSDFCRVTPWGILRPLAFNK